MPASLCKQLKFGDCTAPERRRGLGKQEKDQSDEELLSSSKSCTSSPRSSLLLKDEPMIFSQESFGNTTSQSVQGTSQSTPSEKAPQTPPQKSN